VRVRVRVRVRAHLLVREKLRQRFHAGLEEDREVAPVDDLAPERARAADERPEGGRHLGRTSRDVDRLHVRRGLEDTQHLLDRLLVHRLLAARARLDVAVRARLVAM